jgi:chromosome segregation ATPase
VKAERDQLRAALALGQENCDAVYDELRADCDELRGDVVRLSAERDQLRAEVERVRSDRDCEKRLRKDADEFRENAIERAEKAEADLAAAKERLRSEAMDDYASIKNLQRELATEREKVRVLRAALENLCDEQNGAPLETRRDQWQLAMDEARAAIVATEGSK